MIFFFSALIVMLIGRRFGWAFSKAMYRAPLVLVVAFSLIWGVVIAGAIRELIVWRQPSVVVRWVLGYALGAYVAIPNYGLLDEASVPNEVLARHVVLKGVSLLTYAVCSAAFALMQAASGA